MSTATDTIEQLATQEYKYGFETLIDADTFPPGLNDDVVRAISLKKHEPEWMLEWRLKAFRAWQEMTEPTWPNVHYPPVDFQDISYYSAPKNQEEAGQPRRGRSRNPQDVRQAGHPARASRRCSPASPSTPCSTRVSVATTFKKKLGELGIIFCSFSEAVREPPRAGAQVRRLGRAAHRQLLRRAQLGGVQRRLVRLRAEGRALPDGAVDLLPHQRQGHRPVRAHADHRRRGRLRQLPRRLHGADARRAPAARRGRRAGRARRRHHQVLDRPELVPRRQGRQGRHLQLRHQARQGDDQRQDHVDAGRDGLGHHLEVSELHPAGRQLGRRVLLGRGGQQPAAGRHRHQDAAPRQEHAEHHRLQGHLGGRRPEHLSRPGEDRQGRRAARATTRSAIRC